jgi:hypothetical protein
MSTSDRLTAAEAHAKADECREMARRDQSSEHKIMLEHMAQTWERIARDVQNGA